MSRTRINPVEIFNSGHNAETACRKVALTKKGVCNISDQLDGRIKQRNNVGGQLTLLINTLSELENKIVRIKNIVDTNAQNYQRTDDRVEAQANDLNR